MGDFAAVHLETTGGWPPTNDKSIYIFPHVVLAQFGTNICACCVTSSKSHTEQSNSQPPHFFLPQAVYPNATLARDQGLALVFKNNLVKGFRLSLTQRRALLSPGLSVLNFHNFREQISGDPQAVSYFLKSLIR